MKKLKLSEAWNRSFTQINVKESRTDLDLGDMLKISEEVCYFTSNDVNTVGCGKMYLQYLFLLHISMRQMK